jgi:hypothetical protein
MIGGQQPNFGRGGCCSSLSVGLWKLFPTWKSPKATARDRNGIIKIERGLKEVSESLE